MLGRTHGQAAVPITFSLKAAVWLDEMRRQLIRLDEASPRVASWKILGRYSRPGLLRANMLVNFNASS